MTLTILFVFCLVLTGAIIALVLQAAVLRLQFNRALVCLNELSRVVREQQQMIDVMAEAWHRSMAGPPRDRDQDPPGSSCLRGPWLPRARHES